MASGAQTQARREAAEVYSRRFRASSCRPPIGSKLEDGARKVLSTHRREVAVSVRVPRDDGSFDVYPGWRIQHNGARGPFKGGLGSTPTRLVTSSGASPR